MSIAAARTERELQMLESLVDGAYALAMSFNETMKAERDTAAMLQLFDAYARASQSIRLGIRLCMTLRAPPRAAAARAVTAARDAAPVAIERDDSVTRPERPEALERERDRDYEPVSLPRFLATLGLAARQTERLAERLPPKVAAETLPALRDLLARAKAGLEPAPASTAPVKPGAAVAVLARPPGSAPKAALLASAATPPPRAAAPGAFPRPPPRRR